MTACVVVKSLAHMREAKDATETELRNAWGKSPEKIHSAYAHAYGRLRSCIEIEIAALEKLLGNDNGAP